MATEIDVGAHKYRIEQLDPRAQFHIVRRLSPIAGKVGEIIGGFGGSLTDDTAMEKLLVPLTGTLASMPDGDANFILDTCLAAATRKQGDGPAIVYAPVLARNGQMMFEDIKLPEMMQLVVAVLVENLGRFFVAGVEQSPGEKQA